MTCKDCVHHNLCDANECLRVVTDIIDDYIDTIYLDNSQNRCSHFKNKADFVEVVRCKDCKHKETITDSMNKKTSTICLLGEALHFVEDNHYCSYGERKCNNDS
jgi:hypothetical protein